MDLYWLCKPCKEPAHGGSGTSKASCYEVTALYGPFITKEQNQVYYFLSEAVGGKSVACYESLFDTIRWPEDIGSATTASTDPS